jgi:hypothetical protein
MTELACNFAIARFRPYPETGEYVNVGVVLACPEVGYFGYQVETRRHRRITDFFPELELEIFKTGMRGLLLELGRVRDTGREPLGKFVFLHDDAKQRFSAFKELVRPRESLFHFGEIGTVLANDPETKLIELFDYYVKRQFARDREYQEIIMRKRLGDFLQKENLAHLYKQDYRVGNDDYGVVLPFVHLEACVVRKAIKPLHLDKPSPTDVYRHGDAWIAAVGRLRKINRVPGELLFAVKLPHREKQKQAADEICTELRRLDALTLPFAESEQIRRFAAC